VNQRFRDYLAAAVGIVALTLGAIALVVGRVDFGVTFGVAYSDDGDRIVIDRVAENSPAQRQGFEPGMVVIGINGTQLIRMPEFVCPTPEAECEEGQFVLQPATPTMVPLDGNVVNRLIYGQVTELLAIRAPDLADATREHGYPYVYTGRSYVEELRGTAYMLFVGALLLIVGSWWLTTGRGGPSLKPIGVPLAMATALPFLMRPVEATWYGPALVIEGMLVPFGFALLGFGLSARIEEPEIRGVARMASLGAAIGAMAIGASRLAGNPFALAAPNPSADLVWSALLAATVFLPGLAAAGPLRQSDGSTSTNGGKLLQSAELAAAGATPVMSLLTGAGSVLLFPLSMWLAGIAIAGRSTLRPLARLAVRAQLQRDLIVAATEAERARVAADIHDDALQELTLLVHRLDEAGDEEGAGIARTVSDRLRAICGDLRLPILDDLGVGPALDWLVLRIERLSGGEVRLERSDGTRPPADVELAFFRIAQEALGNAVKHGQPPIMVRYHATDGGASLSVDDAGPGIAPDAATAAERDGRFGLLNMHQRAEAIGAILDIRRWPSGGTHVALEWRPH
jgi:signal transduction histidine kinase